jgi:long-chain acyl-CoA synthetase
MATGERRPPITKPWLQHYPAGVPAEIDPHRWPSIVDIIDDACDRFGRAPCLTNMGVTLTFDEVRELSCRFAAYLRHDARLRAGERIAIQLPNLLQQPVAILGALRAGLVVVNTDPLLTAYEMERCFRDAQISAVVVLANFAGKLEEVLARLDVPLVVVTEVGDLFPLVRRLVTNSTVRYLKRMVPPYRLPRAVGFGEALARGAHRARFDGVACSGGDLAFLQYTGGTTGDPKAAMLTHYNITSNVEQISAWVRPCVEDGAELGITALPLYHIFALVVNCLTLMRFGAHDVLITNPRDIGDLVRTIARHRVSVITGVNTLFNALLNNAEFRSLDFSALKLCVGGAAALQRVVVERWMAVTGSSLIEGYGLTEASPVVTCNPVGGTDRIGSIGLPLPSADVRIVDENGNEVPVGSPGELLVQGPQVMSGYWRQSDGGDAVRGGWLYTGDVAQQDEDGFFRIVDRKKDVIIVSGWHVYPNEIEDALASHPGVLEVAAVGVPDARRGEAVRAVVVRRTPGLTAEEVIAFARTRLAPYKVPTQIEFRDELPKSQIGKILRRALRHE